MGESKVALFLERVADAARSVFDDVIAVANALGGVRPHPKRIRVIVEEPHEGEGAIFGVVRALQDAQSKCFVLAVDYPLITPEVLRFIRDREGMPEWNGRPQPLCAVWDSAWLPRIEERIARGELDLRGAFESDMIIPESELRSRFSGEPLLNVNTPEEWDRAQRFLASR
jgi:molybdopterin-guanine dinucleotide biosynthesis protein A